MLRHQFWNSKLLAKFAMLFSLRSARRPPRLSEKFRGLDYRLWRLASFLSIFSAISVSSVAADDQLPFDAASLDNRIASYVAQLDDLSFVAREKAMQELAVIGCPAIRPLAIKVLKGSPEAAWRAKHSLELIGTQGNEDTFYKSIGVLQLFYLAGSESLRGKIAQLQQQWRLEQKKNAIDRLRTLGATVLDPLENAPAFANELDNFGGPFFANDFLMPAPAEIVFSGDSTLPESNFKPRPEFKKSTLNTVETTREIDQILTASLAENRERILSDSADPSEALDLTPTDIDQARLLPIEMRIQRMQIVAAARQNGDFLNFGSGGGITVSLDERWQGSVEDLREMQKLTGLSRIELSNFNPGAEQLAELSKLSSITALKIVGTELSVDEFAPLAELSQLSELEFADRVIDAEVLKKFSASKSLGHLSFTDCEIGPTVLHELATYPALRSIFFEEMQIESSIFQALESLDNLNYVNLSICKFETAAYRKFEAARPMLQIAFTPQAFLGVRGGALNYDDLAGCEISEVVADSGAERGGLLVGDQIESVDGQPIERFEDLRLHIAQHKVGEILTVVVSRDGKPIELKIELSQNQANRE